MAWKVPYMTVTHRDQDSMKLLRSPPARAWMVFFVIVAMGAYCAYESRSWTYGSFYFACGVMLAHVAMDRWEECHLDRSKNKVKLFYRTLLDRVLFRQPGRCVVSNLSEIVDVRVESETLKYAGTTFNIVLVSDTGYTLGLTSTGTYGNKEEQEKLASEIRDFLNLVSPTQILENLEALVAEKVARSGPPPTSSPDDNDTNTCSDDPLFAKVTTRSASAKERRKAK